MQTMIDFLFKNKFLIFLILLAFLTRFYLLTKVPPALNVDEVSHGYNAYSLLLTGKDEWGVAYPVLFRAYGDFKLPVYIYLTAAAESIFGVSEFAVRLPSALAGVLTVIFVWLLTKKIFGPPTAFLAAFLVIFEPWSFFLSRPALEANLALFFVVAGFYFFLVGLEKPKYILIAVLLLGFSVWTYNSARVFVPLLVVFLLIFYRKTFITHFPSCRKIYIVAVLIIFVFFAPMFYQIASSAGQARYRKVAILNEGTIQQINYARSTSELPEFWARAVHNKLVYFLFAFGKNWLSHFSFAFLFEKGSPYGSYSVPGYGLLYKINFAFLLVGLFVILQNRKKDTKFLLVWFLLAPVAASITRESPHTLRSIFVIPIPMIITAVGVFGSYSFFQKKGLGKIAILFLAVYAIGILGSIEKYLRSYFFDYPVSFSQNWQYGYKDLVEYLKKHYDEYDQIIITKKYSEPHEFLLFFWKWNPEAYRNDPGLVRFYQDDWYWVDRFDKFYFINDWDIPRNSDDFLLESGIRISCFEKSCLLATSPDNYPHGWQLKHQVRFLNGQVAFDIVSKK